MVPIISSSNHSVWATRSSSISNTFSIPILSSELLNLFFRNSFTTALGKKSNSPFSKIQSTTSFSAEKDVVDWIFENGELDFLPKAVVNEFLKNRFNNSLESIGIEKVFDIDEDLVAQTEWFDDEIIGTKHGDFFVKRSINYSKRSQSITSDDLF